MLVLSILDCVPDHMGGSTGNLSAVGDCKCECGVNWTVYLIKWVAKQGSYLLLEMVSVSVEYIGLNVEYIGLST